MIETASGLILRVRPLTETSLIVYWLTPDLGRISTVAKGARRPKSPFAGKLDLFYLADFSFSRSRRSDLHTLTEVSLRETHSGLRRDFGYLQQASYCAALIEQSTETETPLEATFELMRGFLEHLVEHPPQPQSLFAFELKHLGSLGLDPAMANPTLSAGASSLAAALSRGDWMLIARVKPSPAQVRELAGFLGQFILFHLGRVPKGRSAALGFESEQDPHSKAKLGADTGGFA